MEAEDFGFHNFDTAMENGDILVLSGFKILPNAGGWNDQFAEDAEDLKTYLRGLAWARNLKGNEDGTEVFDQDDEGKEPGIPGIADSGGDWQANLK